MAPQPGPRPLLRADGSSELVRLNARKPRIGDLYHWLVTTPRTRFVMVLMGGYIGINAVFALAYMSCGNGIENVRPGSFEDAFFFSVQTMATIGYGRMSPVSLAAHILVTIEAGIGLFSVAMAAALMFTRFTKPTPGVRFSQQAVVCRMDGRPTLMFRLANERTDQINEARVNVVLARFETTAEGKQFRRLVDLALVRSFTPLFSLSWSIMHVIDETSPLFGQDAGDLLRGEADLVVLLSGHHEGFQQEVHARHAYSGEDIVWGKRFLDVFCQTADGRRAIDYGRFDQVETDDAVLPQSSVIETAVSPVARP